MYKHSMMKRLRSMLTFAGPMIILPAGSVATAEVLTATTAAVAGNSPIFQAFHIGGGSLIIGLSLPILVSLARALHWTTCTPERLDRTIAAGLSVLISLVAGAIWSQGWAGGVVSSACAGLISVGVWEVGVVPIRDSFRRAS